MIKYIDDKQTINKGSNLIFNITDAQNHWTAKFISNKWTKPEKAYHQWHDKFPDLFQLGQVQIIPVENNTFVITMLALEESQTHELNLRFDAFKECCKHIINSLNYDATYSIHLFSCDLQIAKEYLARMEKILENTFDKKQIPIYIYR